jgi:hypothetical protein
MKQHRGISMHAIPVGANIGGAIFTIGIIVAVLIGLPIAKWFLLESVLGGVAVFFIFRLFRRPQKPNKLFP